MSWKENTLAYLSKQATVEPISCSDDTYVVRIERGNETLRTIIHLDAENEQITYKNSCIHCYTTGEDAVKSMHDHLYPVEA